MNPRRFALALSLALLAGCGSQTAGGSGGIGSDGTGPSITSPDAAALAAAFDARAATIAAAWQAKGLARLWATSFMPIGPLTLEPPTGYAPNGNLKASIGNGWIRSTTALPTATGTGVVRYADGTRTAVPIVSAQQAYDALVAARPRLGDCPPPEGSSSGCDWASVTGATLGTATISTSRGSAVVPAWRLEVDGLDEPMVQVAVSDSATTPLPHEIVPDTGTPGLRTPQGLVAATGTSITVELGLGACDREVAARVWEDDEIIVVGGTALDPEPGTACQASLELRQVTVTTRAPIGNRPVVSIGGGQPIGPAAISLR